MFDPAFRLNFFEIHCFLLDTSLKTHFKNKEQYNNMADVSATQICRQLSQRYMTMAKVGQTIQRLIKAPIYMLHIVETNNH